MKFFEAFPQIESEAGLKELFINAEIEGIDISHSKNSGVVHITNASLIRISDIRKMEKKLNETLLGKSENRIRICDRYKKKEEDTPGKIYQQYKDSFLYEINENGGMMRTVFLSCATEFEGNILTLKLSDDCISRTLGERLKNYFYVTYQNRFGIDLLVQLYYIKKEKTSQTNLEIIRNNTEIQKAELNNSVSPVEGIGTVRDIEEKHSTTVVYEEKPKKETVFTKKSGAYEKGKFKKKKLPLDPDIIYGNSFEGSITKICDIQDEIGDVVLRGQVTGVELRELKIEKTLMTFLITDFTDTIKVKLFLKEEQLEELKPEITEGIFLMLRGIAQFDSFDHELGIGSVSGIKKIKNFIVKRMDNAEVKRIELHAHTKMSDMDAVVPPAELIKTAFRWGHRAVAITDHGVVQGFTEAFHAIDKKKLSDEDKERFKEFKIIYGVEAYLVDDVKEIAVGTEERDLNSDYAAISITTTGTGIEADHIIELSAVRCSGESMKRFHTYVSLNESISPELSKQSGVTDEKLAGAPELPEALALFLTFVEDCVLLSYNAAEEIGFLSYAAKCTKLPFSECYVDVVSLCRMLFPDYQSYRIGAVTKELHIKHEGKGAKAISEAIAEIFPVMKKILEEKEIKLLDGLNSMGRMSEKAIKTMPVYHAVILCRNDIGRVNLYRLISYSHINYFQKRPRIPKSVFMQYREGLIIGSACEAGELYRALVFQRPEAEIRRLAKFYDYYEIQPVGNNEFMINDDDFYVSSFDDIRDLNRKVVSLGEEYNKPVVATCDVHFLNPEDEIYRRIIMAGQGFKDADRQPPLYFHTTDEMLEEFSYLGPEKAYEVVVTNTNRIADSIEKIEPVRPDKCPPVIEDSDITLRTICNEKAHSMYGNPLPAIVEDRLDHELNSIIKNGFAVMYIIAQKLVWKSNEDGYLVGSRGSVGSSFVATMAGITEVNPLPAHYYCPKCHYSDFDSEIVKKNPANSGFDLPDAVCPVCGAVLKKDGNNIPFETFLGFNGDKEPDIDLNFSGEYQSKAHDYTEVIFGKGHTFRAGTITGLADKTAYGYVMKYYEEHQIHKRRVEMERIAKGCEGVRKSTGQHPGGIIVLPHGEEIYSFTPVQRPANDMTTNTVTTHFDYHSIDHNLLKLDILGHDDPTMIRMLQDITGLDAQTIPMDDQKVISLFESPVALGIRPEDIDGCPLGSLGLPELGTDLVIRMLIETKPKSFSDMIRISGLSHGTDVWANNAQTLIAEKKCTLSSAICTRDDIMIYLISKKIDPGVSFKIMESVRKGKGLSEEWEQLMLEHDVPEWYIWSCKRIQYMFPKAHACAYVMMAFRIAYFKIYYPQAYYAAYFSIRATAMDYRLMCRGKDLMLKEMEQLKKRSGSKDPAIKLSNKEEDILKDMKNVLEMYARGFEFLPIDIFKANATRFQVIDGKIMPSLNSIDGLGEKAAIQIEEAVKNGPFLSKDDFRNRCKVSATVADTMGELGLLGDIPESNQMSLMDFLG